jgi:hypothetical protein
MSGRLYWYDGHNKPTPRVYIRNQGGGYKMFDIWEVIEELVTVADERGSKTISMSQIGQELKDAEQNTARNIQEVRKSLVELGYRVGA